MQIKKRPVCTATIGCREDFAARKRPDRCRPGRHSVVLRIYLRPGGLVPPCHPVFLPCLHPGGVERGPRALARALNPAWVRAWVPAADAFAPAPALKPALTPTDRASAP